MSITPEGLIDDFIADGWGSHPYEKYLEMRAGNPGSAFEMLRLALERNAPDATFLHHAMIHVDEDQLGTLAERSIEMVTTGTPSELAWTIIAQSDRQCPVRLVPHLVALYESAPSNDMCKVDWSWRMADESIVRFLVSRLPRDGYRAWRTLLQVRSEQAILLAHSAHSSLQMPSAHDFSAYAMEVGFAYENGRARRLHLDRTWHIVFRKSDIEPQPRASWLSTDNHPTWQLRQEPVVKTRFGGLIAPTCGICHSRLHRIIDIPVAVRGDDMPGITLATCLSCLGWCSAELHYHHDPSGMPTPLDQRATATRPEFPSEGLKECEVTVVETPSRWRVQTWGMANGWQNLNRLGGYASWVQGAQHPACATCGDTMVFIAQFDSDLPAHPDGEWLWGSGGMGYFFWCHRCRNSAALWQCT